MIHIFAKQDSVVQKELHYDGDDISTKSILWLDLLNPTIDEISYISKLYEIEIPTKEEREEI